MGRFTRWLLRDDLATQRTASEEVLQKLLEIERTRLTSNAELDKLKRELEYKNTQLELEHIEAISEEKRKDRAHKEQLRYARQQHAAAMREKLALKRAAGQIPVKPKLSAGVPGCTVCMDPSSANLTAEEIKWHSAGHPGAMN